ncbi:MAG: hypothetical protein LBK70_02315 [Clostridiales bacterium]|nr:hypothetical protein [Clostridiales bacterium]
MKKHMYSIATTEVAKLEEKDTQLQTDQVLDTSSHNIDQESGVQWQEDIVRDVLQDFDKRRANRRYMESKWQLNTNFWMGNQHTYVNLRGDIQDIDTEYSWQERETYNHIAPIIETRLAKLGRVRPKMSVRPFSGDDNDIRAATVSSKILDSACSKINLDQVVSRTTTWSEVAGSAFYKIGWDSMAGKRVGGDDDNPIFEGDIFIDSCSPYEIFPNSLAVDSIQDCNSIIHARAMHVDDIEHLWGKHVEHSTNNVDLDIVGFVAQSNKGQLRDNNTEQDYCIVIERYTRPNKQHPNGELVIVAGNTLLHYGDLPYVIGDDGKYDLPFVKQDALFVPGSFYGVSIIERAIPIQRAYNAVKNRKHEFLNRLAVGVLAVEDGSVDVDNLVQEGLAPGKIISYRQGGSIPRMLDSGRVPPEFNYEEDRLRNEFITISGVSEIVRNSDIPGQVSSGVAIQLLLEQDDTRLSLSAQSIRVAIRRLAQYAIRMYKQFAMTTRLDRIVGEDGEVELLTWRASDLNCDDVVFDTVNELSNTPAAKQNMLFELLRNGLLYNQEGKLSDSMRHKMLDALGYGGWENSQSLDGLHIKRATLENINILKEDSQVEEIDNHEMHIEVHTSYLLSGSVRNSRDYSKVKRSLLAHIKQHKQYAKLQAQAVVMENKEINN